MSTAATALKQLPYIDNVEVQRSESLISNGYLLALLADLKTNNLLQCS